MLWDISTVPEPAQKLEPDQQAVWVEVANRAMDEGYDEAQAVAVAYTAAKKVGAGEALDIIYNYVPWRPGKFRAAVGGEFDIEPEDVDDVTYAVNHLYELGVPLKLMAGYHGLDGQEPFMVGMMPAARVREDGKMGSALVGDKFFIDDIRQGIRTLSIDADRDYESPAYTEGKTFRYWPMSWAVLPEAVQPGVPPGEPLAASEKKNQVRICASETAPEGGVSPIERGQDMSAELEGRIEKLEAAQAEKAEKITTLEGENSELRIRLEAAEQERDQLKQEKESADLAAAEAAVTERANTIMAAEARPGVREKMQKRLEAAEGVDAKNGLLDAWETVIGENEIESAKLRASEAKPEGEDSTDSRIQAAEQRAKNENIPFLKALELECSKKGE